MCCLDIDSVCILAAPDDCGWSLAGWKHSPEGKLRILMFVVHADWASLLSLGIGRTGNSDDMPPGLMAGHTVSVRDI